METITALEICFLTATELVRLVRAKELSALEVMEAHLAQIERVNPEVNAIVILTAERAMDRASATDDAIARGEEVGLLGGLPVAHKDLFPTEGVRTTFGSLVYKDFVPDHNALIVERLRGAGAISVGKTNTPEFGAGSQTFNEFLVSPVSQVPPFDVQQRYVTEIDGERMETYLDWMKSCYYVTVAGLPVASVSCGFTTEGLPVGAQIVGKYGDDFGVLQLAHAFEVATRHGERRPPLAG
jgi:Asp-tRNA(Asn)/Glu-tRNA(Gln) amidotransferase A subunit family amidase